MITHENGIFHIKTSEYSYLFRINNWGLPEHLHFGTPVRTQDAAAFACTPGLGWGSSILLDDSDTASCPDALPLEWSSAGRGDYREPPLELGGATDFRFVGFEIHQGILPMGLPQARDGGETLVITLEQPGAQLQLIYTAFDSALTRRAVLKNTGESPMTLTKLMSFQLDLPGDYQMTTFDGGWIAEMRRHTAPVRGSRVVNESTTGSSSNRHNPGFMIHERTNC